MLNAVRSVAAAGGAGVHEGADVARLRVIIEELTAMKNDAQQRSWSIYDDSTVIAESVALSAPTAAPPDSACCNGQFFPPGASLHIPASTDSVSIPLPESPTTRCGRYLEELLALVTEADPRVVAKLVATYTSVGQLGQYEILDTLVVYYQMETR